MRNVLNLLKIAGLVSALAVAAACGGDGNENPPNDAGNGDGNGDGNNIVPAELRSGTIAVLEVSLTNPLPQPVSGATISISYTDLESIEVQPAVGTDPPALGECAVWIYDANQRRPTADEGMITIEGGRSLIPPCVFRNGAYQCPLKEDTVAVGSVFGDENAGVSPVTLAGVESLCDPSPVGMFLETSGFEDPSHNGLFPITSCDPATFVINVAGVPPDQGLEVVEDGETPQFAILAGEGPHPANADFLDAGISAITITGAGGPIVPGFSFSDLTASGEGLTLDDNSALLHELPGVAQDVTFSCDGPNGTCGVNGTGGIVGFAFSGSTSDADHTGVPPGVLLPPVTAYAEFQCRGQLGQNSITLTEQALAAVLSTNPTRIQTQLLRVTALLNQAEGTTTAIVGHGLVGTTDL